jgi:hypothetical protein
MAAVTGAIGAGLGAVSAVGGAIKGARGTPATGAVLPGKSKVQKGLEKDSLANYQAQMQLAQGQEQAMQSANQMRDPAIQAYLQQISGEAFNLTPQEQANIQGLRSALVSQGQADVQNFVDEGLVQATSGAAARGLRGQALGQTRGGVINKGTQQMGSIVNQANTLAAQQAMQMPYQRVQAQQGALQQGLTYGDNLRNQASANRQSLQSPYLLSQLQNDRLARAGQPAQPGGFWGGLTGGIAGAASGLGSAANMSGSLRDLGLMSAQSSGGGGGSSGGPSFDMPSFATPICWNPNTMSWE